MSAVNQFAYGSVTLVIAFLMSFIGAGLGLACTVRARLAVSRGRRARWLVLGACGIGGAGVWLMQFMALLGFEVPSSTVRYDVPLTVTSMVIAIVSVGAGLFAAEWGRPRPARAARGGLIIGVGLAATHYTGVAALDFGGRLSYQPSLLLLAIGAVAATSIGMVWAARSTRRWQGTAAAALGLAAALTVTHYASMAAIQVRIDPDATVASGVDPTLLMAPVAVITTLALMVLLFAAMSMMTDEEFAKAAELGTRATPIRTPRPRALIMPVYVHQPAPHRHRLPSHAKSVPPRLPRRRV